MTTDQLNDPVFEFLLKLNDAWGSVWLFFVLFVAFFVVTATIAWSEIKTKRYQNSDGTPFFQNFSTIVDFALLDPLLIVLVVRATAFMMELPYLLEGTVALDSQAYAVATDRYMADLGSRAWCLFLVASALVGYAAYSFLGKSRRTRRSLRTWIDQTPRNGVYIAAATTLLMYVALMYFYRAVRAAQFVVTVTEDGFIRDPAIWTHGAELVGRYQLEFSYAAGVMAAIVVAFAIHDFFLHKGKRNALRVATSGPILALAVATVFFGSVIGVHDNLVRVLATESTGLVNAYRSAVTTSTDTLAVLQGFPSWTLELKSAAGLVAAQAIAVLSAAISRENLAKLRAVFGADCE